MKTKGEKNMEKSRRNAEEMERDFRKIKEIAKKAKTMKEIQEAMNLSYVGIRTTLAKHTGAEERIKQKLANNRQKAKAKTKIKKTQQKNEPKKEQQQKPKQLEGENNQKITINEKKKETSEKNKSIVIDASITGLAEFKEICSHIMESKTKIILTSVTIKELEKIQTFSDLSSMNARYVLGLAAENEEIFNNVLIDETKETADECIINYCAEHHEEVSLWTSDKTMTLKARMYSVCVNYFKQEYKAEGNRPNKKQENKIRTLYPAKKIGNSLFITEFDTPNRSLSVLSDNKEYSEGVRELRLGDDVLLATQKTGYMTFAHYQIISFNEENNCRLIFSKRFYDGDECKLPKEEYQAFIDKFLETHQ
jgi:rRNA-processing protein FCF1